jgi:CMP-N-acetylneuraminic acid synthetase
MSEPDPPARLEVLAVIPARGGSKGLPGKNLREVAGRSLVARAVDAARTSRMVTRVLGSTDDTAIAAAMRQAGAEVPVMRPAELAADDTPDAPVFLHVLEVLGNDGYRPDIVVNVRPTAPLRTGADIDAALELLVQHRDARSVKSVSDVSEHPYKMWTLGPDGIAHPLLPSWHAQHHGDPDVSRHALPQVHRSNGAVDAVWATALLKTGMFHPGPVVAYVMDATRSVDVDVEQDLDRAEGALTGEHGAGV